MKFRMALIAISLTLNFRGDKMKKIMVLMAFIVCVFCLFLNGTSVAATFYTDTIRIANDQKVVAGGTSVYMIDMESTQPEQEMGMNVLKTIASELAYVNPLDANFFSFQFSSATPYSTALTGATIPMISYAVSNYIPSGLTGLEVGTLFDGKTITEKIEFTPITLKNTAHDSGISKYQHTASIKSGRYHFIKIDNTEGPRDFRMDFEIKLHKSGDQPQSILISEGTFTMPVGGSGVSQFTAASIIAFPDGVGVLYAELVSGTSCYYTTSGTAPTAGTGNVLYKGTLMPFTKNLARTSQWIAGTDECVIRYRFQTRKEEE